MKFGHHLDPAIDFCVEVEELQGMACNRRWLRSRANA
jgi:hypothetical protein